MNDDPLALLQLRLHQLRQERPCHTTDDARNAVLSALSEYASCDRVNGRMKTFGQLYEICFGHASDKREKTKRWVE